MPIQRNVLHLWKLSFKNFLTLVNNLVLSVLIKFVNLIYLDNSKSISRYIISLSSTHTQVKNEIHPLPVFYYCDRVYKNIVYNLFLTIFQLPLQASDLQFWIYRCYFLFYQKKLSSNFQVWCQAHWSETFKRLDCYRWETTAVVLRIDLSHKMQTKLDIAVARPQLPIPNPTNNFHVN